MAVNQPGHPGEYLRTLAYPALPIAAAAATGGILALDLLVPAGSLIPLLYTVPLLLTWWLPQPAAPLLAAGVGVVLTAAVTLAGDAAPEPAALANRGAVVITLVLVAAALQRAGQLRMTLAAAEDSVQTAERAARAIFAAAGTPQARLDPATGRFGAANAAFCRLLGYRETAMPGLSVAALTHPDHRHADLERYRQIAAGSAPDRKFVTRWQRQDGTDVKVQLDVGLLPAGSGTPPACFVFAREVPAAAAAAANGASLSGLLLRAQDDERQRIARDLHDDYSQRLADIAIELHRIAGWQDTASLPAQLRMLKLEVDGIASDLHSLARDLHPSIIDHSGLAPALRELVTSYGRLYGLRVGVAVTDGLPAIPADHATCLYRVAQEALRNIVSHAEASDASVRLAEQSGGIEMCIRDNGNGLAAGGRPFSGDGIGIISMRGRLHALGGTFAIGSAPDGGTEVHAWLPVVAAGTGRPRPAPWATAGPDTTPAVSFRSRGHYPDSADTHSAPATARAREES